MHKFVVLLLVLCALAVHISARNLVGGTYPIDIHEPEVIDAAKFAMERAYKDKKVEKHLLVSAAYQIVNGKRYVLVVEVKEPAEACVSKQFEVWDRAGPPGQFLVGNTQISRPCEWF